MSGLLQRVREWFLAPKALVSLRPWQRRAIEGVILVVVGVVLLVECRRLWFFADDWHVILDRRQARLDGRFGDFVWAPLNEHLVGGLVLIYSAVIALFGVSSQVPLLVLLVAGLTALCWLFSVLLRRSGIAWWWSIVAMSWLALFGSGNENLIWPVQIGYVWSQAFVLAAAVIAMRNHDPAGNRGTRELLLDATASVLCVLGLFMGPIAVVMMLALGGALVATPVTTGTMPPEARWWSRYRPNWLRAIRIFPVPVGLYLWWYLTYRVGTSTGAPGTVRQTAAYFLRGVTNAMDRSIGVHYLGTVLAIVAVVLIATRWRQTGVWSVLFFCVLGFVLFFGLTAINRADLGTLQSTSPRYVYTGGFFLIPVYVMAADEVLRRCRLQQRRVSLVLTPVVFLVIAALGIVAVFTNARELHYGIVARTAVLRDTRPTIEIAALHASSPIVDPALEPEPVYDWPVTMGGLAELVRSGLWTPSTSWPLPTLLDRSLRFGIVVRPELPVAAVESFGLEVVGVTGLVRAVNGCHEFVATPEAPATLSFPSDAPGGFVWIQRLADSTGRTGTDNPDGGGVVLSARLRSGDVVTPLAEVGSLDGEPSWLGVDPFAGSAEVQIVPSRSTGTVTVSVCGLRGIG